MLRGTVTLVSFVSRWSILGGPVDLEAVTTERGSRPLAPTIEDLKHKLLCSHLVLIRHRHSPFNKFLIQFDNDSPYIGSLLSSATSRTGKEKTHASSGQRTRLPSCRVHSAPYRLRRRLPSAEYTPPALPSVSIIIVKQRKAIRHTQPHSTFIIAGQSYSDRHTIRKSKLSGCNISSPSL